METLRITVTIGNWYQPTEAESNACPAVFRCFNCLDKFPKDQLGGLVADEWICSKCRSHVDTWSVGLLRKFDNRAKKHLGARKTGQRPQDVVKEDWVLIDGVWKDAWTGFDAKGKRASPPEDVKLTPEQEDGIQRVKADRMAWCRAKAHGFPGFGKR